jgi:hypothetical protein
MNPAAHYSKALRGMFFDEDADLLPMAPQWGRLAF